MNITKTNLCELSKHIKSVKGMESNSTSPTDTWFIKFDGFKYAGEKITNGFMKLYIAEF